MKVLQQPKLTVGTEGKILIDSTNVNNHGSATKNSISKKRKCENCQPSKLIRKDGIYCDPQPPVKIRKLTDIAVQTDPSPSHDEEKEKIQRVKDMLTNDEAPSEYWEAMAEKRRQALEVTLEDNKKLMEENGILKEENQILEELLEEAKKLASLVQDITNESAGDSCELPPDTATEEGIQKGSSDSQNGSIIEPQ